MASWTTAKWRASHGVLSSFFYGRKLHRYLKIVVDTITASSHCPARNGPYSKCFGKWSGLTPDEVREDMLQDLRPLSQHKGVRSLLQKLANGSSGEAMVLINACKCIHVVKNWTFVVRSSLSYKITTFLMTVPDLNTLYFRQFVANSCPGNWWQEEVPQLWSRVSRVMDR